MMGVFVQTNVNSPKAASAPVGYVIQENGCWQWTGANNGAGHGQMWEGGRLGYFHRIMWERANGPIPQGTEVDHLCRNRGCGNPSHLEIVSHRENVIRGTAPTATNAKKTHCPLGHRLAGGNLILEGKSRGRKCRECKNRRDREYHARRREGHGHGPCAVLVRGTA